MAGPWEKYSQSADRPAAEDNSGPWSKYSAKPSDDSEPSVLAQTGRGLVNSLPLVGGVVGGFVGTPLAGPAGTAVGAAVGGGLGQSAKNLINSYLDPDNVPKSLTDAVVDTGKAAAEQGSMQGAGEFAAPYISKAVNAVATPIADGLSALATKKAVAATGATGKQALKFAPNAGQELLDQGIVKFGNSQAAVAKKATDALDQSGETIGNLLTDLDKRGATVDHADIVNKLRQRASELGKNPAQFKLSDSLNGLADRIGTMIESGGGESKIPLTEAEAFKRDFQNSANYNSSPLDLTHAKEAASIYKQAVEDAATKFDPKAADAFAAAKKNYGLLAPIQDAAEKRAATLAQSPHGGLLDTAALIAGEGAGGAAGAVVAPIARRFISTRIPSTIAATANNASGFLRASPLIADAAAPAALQSQAPAATRAASGAIRSGVQRLMPMPAAAQNSAPVLGEDKWAQNGVNKLGIDEASAQRLLSDPRTKSLLIQASDLPPNSKAMQSIRNQLMKGLGKS